MNEPVPKTAGRLRTIVTSRPVLFALAALLVYALAGFLLAPWLVRQQLPALVDKHLGAQGSVAAVRINPFLLTLEASDLAISEKNGTPAVQVGRLFVDLEAVSLLRWTWTFREIRLERLLINAELDAKENLNLARLHGNPAQDAPAAATQEPDGLPRLLLQHFSISGGVFRFTDHTLQPVARAQFDPVNFEMHDVSTLPDHRGEHALTARLPSGGNLKWQGRFKLAPLDSSGTIRLDGGKLATLWRFVQDQLTIAEPAGSYELGLNYRLRYQGGALDLQAEQLALRLKDVAIAKQTSNAPLGKIAAIAFEDGRFDLGKRSLEFGDVRIGDGAINVVLDPDGTPDWARLVRPAPVAAAKSAESEPAPAATAPKSPWQITLPKIGIGPLALAVTDHSRVKPLSVSLARAEAGLGLSASIGTQTQLAINNASVKFGDLGIRSGDDKQALVTLAAAELTEAGFDLQQKSVRAGALRLSGGKTRVVREDDGGLNLAMAFAAKKPTPATKSTFSFALDRAEISGHSVSFADRSFSPALAYDFEQLRAAMSKFTLPAKAANPVELALRVKQGGSLQAKGSVDLLKQTADVRLTLAGLALRPVDPVLKRHTTLTIVSGKADAGGRVTWGGNINPAAIRYTGTAALTDVDLRVATANERLFSWQRFAATGMDIDLGANRIAIERLDLLQPYAKLVINKDRSTNLGDIRPARQAPASSNTPAPPGATPMAVSIERVSVERGAMDFTDLSLVLPFSTHIKALGGAVGGLSSDGGSRASLKFEGRIDEYGLARAEGTIQPFTPKKFTDIAVTFRNVALTPLSPYSATFAGRKIASGKLSLDLQYKLDNSQLAGDNKVLLEQFTLGEQVKSPTAVNLPLDLAIALLTDSDGRIDLAVPVTGNVDNPEFSYGHLIWQAIRTVITRIVTAPFRALGALFGGGADSSAGDIVFDPGSARILPTEYEKLRRVAEGLQKRPQLKLVVQGLFHKDSDSRALRTQAVRADLAAREGLKLAPGEDPGPVAFDNAKTQRALEIMLNERVGSDAAAQFAEAFRKSAGREASRVNPVLAMMGRGAGDRALYEALYQRLIELQPLPDTALTELAKNRSDRIIGAFTKRLKFDPARLGSKPAEAADETVKNGVPVKLSFEPIKP